MNKQELLLNKINKSSSLDGVQKYIKKVIQLRGFDDQSMEKRMLMLTEEVGELAKAVRKSLKHSVDENKITNYTSVEEEVADVFIVLSSICNKLNINLIECVINKEKENARRTWKK